MISSSLSFCLCLSLSLAAPAEGEPASTTEAPAIEVTPAASILDDLGADSLDVVEMVMALEEQFDIEVPDEDVEELRTVADVERYVVGAVGAS